MGIDLSQFFEVFFEESFEGLDAMEAELINLEPGDLDSETINTIFRAAHSIKGGSGTFGFNSVADFTHVLETLLDQIRNGERNLETIHVNLLLKSVDCLREMLGALQSEQEPDLTDSSVLKAEFEAILNIEQNNTQASGETVNASSLNTYQVDFKPLHHLFKTGNEPLYIFSELAELGECSVSSNLTDLPDIHDIQPDECYLAWTFFLETHADDKKIKEVFEWVEDDAKIEVTLCGGLFEDSEPVSEAAPIIEPEIITEEKTPDPEVVKPPVNQLKNHLKPAVNQLQFE